MKAVCHLLCTRGTEAGSLRIKTTSVPPDHLNLGVLLKPTCGRFDRAIRQHINHLSPFQIHEYGSITSSPLPTPVVNADHAQHRDGWRPASRFRSRKMVSSL